MEPDGSGSGVHGTVQFDENATHLLNLLVFVEDMLVPQ
jgi:hypothetical protein